MIGCTLRWRRRTGQASSGRRAGPGEVRDSHQVTDYLTNRQAQRKGAEEMKGCGPRSLTIIPFTETGKQRMELALAAEASAAKARVMRVERRGLRVDFYS